MTKYNQKRKREREKRKRQKDEGRKESWRFYLFVVVFFFGGKEGQGDQNA